MAVEVGEGFGVVGDHGIEVERLRVGEVGVGDGRGDGGPVGSEPAAKAVGVVAGAEVVVAGFGVAFLAFELVVVLRAGVGVRGTLATKGIKICIVADDSSVCGGDARGAEQVLNVIDWGAASREHGDALAAEENIFGGIVAGRVGFRKNFAARAIPVELVWNGWDRGVGLGDATAVAVINVSRTSGDLELAFRVPSVGVDTIDLGVD